MKKSIKSICILLVLSFNHIYAKPFITIWDTEKSGETNEKTIRIPISGESFTIKWEELNNPKNNGVRKANYYCDIVFSKPGKYKVSISGNYNRIEFNNKGDKHKLIEIVQWGNAKWISFANAFNGCSNLICSAIDAPNLNLVTDLSYMFHDAENFNGTIGNWNTSKITNMAYMFRLAKHFNQPIGKWNVSSVSNMEDMFTQASEFNQPIGIWNTAHVTNMKAMFFLAEKFNQPIGNWNTKNVTDMETMFEWASEFNQSIGNWDVSSVQIMNGMFKYANKFNQPLGNWNTHSIIHMNAMFYSAKNFNQDINSWNVSKVTEMEYMFWDAANFDQYIGDWDISSVTKFDKIFGFTNYRSTGNYKLTVAKWLKVVPKNGQNFEELFSNGKLYE